MSSSASTTASYLPPRPKYVSRQEQTAMVWRDQMMRLAELRISRSVSSKCLEIDTLIDYSIERIPPQIRSMKLSDFALLSTDRQNQLITCSVFPADYTGNSTTKRSLQKTDNHSQTPTYTAVKRQRSEMESDGKLCTKIRTQLAQQSQHIILPHTAEFLDMTVAKKQQIMSILNAIISTYEDLET